VITMSNVDIENLAEIVDDAANKAHSIEQFSETGRALSLSQAYQVQKLSIDRRLQRGEKLVGFKMGFTSRAKMTQMGVKDMIWGRLTDAMQVPNGGSINLKGYVHPRIEPEIAFRLRHDLCGEISLQEATDAIEAVAPAMEIIDSRYENFKFSLEDVVADNSSSSGFVVGDWIELNQDISDLGIKMLFGDEIVQSGSSAAILDNPIQSLVEASRLAEIEGMVLKTGWVILAGSATAAEALKPNIKVTCETEGLGALTVSIAG
jgi:2-oxo-3-hexenedioate decarboxylase